MSRKLRRNSFNLPGAHFAGQEGVGQEGVHSEHCSLKTLQRAYEIGLKLYTFVRTNVHSNVEAQSPRNTHIGMQALAWSRAANILVMRPRWSGRIAAEPAPSLVTRSIGHLANKEQGDETVTQ